MTKSSFCFVNIVLVLLTHWKLGYCITEYTLYGPKGNITSQNYPNGYPENYDVTWKITVQSGQRIRLVIKDLNFAENCALCDCDTVIVYDISDDGTSWTELGGFCTSITSPPKVFVSTGSRMDIDFYTGYRRKAGRGLWFYYEAFPLFPPNTTTTTRPIHIIYPSTNKATDKTPTPTSSRSSPSTMSTVESTILAVAVVLTVVITVLVIFVCGIKKRLTRRRSPSSPQPRTDQTQETSIETFDQFGDHPPSYEEATRSPHYNFSTTPPPYTPEPNEISPENASSSPQTSVAIDSQTNEAYDSTGLPTYAEAHRLSQDSLDRV